MKCINYSCWIILVVRISWALVGYIIHITCTTSIYELKFVNRQPKRLNDLEIYVFNNDAPFIGANCRNNKKKKKKSREWNGCRLSFSITAHHETSNNCMGESHDGTDLSQFVSIINSLNTLYAYFIHITTIKTEKAKVSECGWWKRKIITRIQ